MPNIWAAPVHCPCAFPSQLATRNRTRRDNDLDLRSWGRKIYGSIFAARSDADGGNQNALSGDISGCARPNYPDHDLLGIVGQHAQALPRLPLSAFLLGLR